MKTDIKASHEHDILNLDSSRHIDIYKLTNLNELTEPGEYIFHSYTFLGEGSPVNIAGKLKVTASGLFVYQEYISQTPISLYIRVRFNGVWRDWVHIGGKQ